MDINLTLIIQIANFWITYTVLSKWLFKPFMQFIDQKEAAKAVLHQDLEEKEETLLVLQQGKKQNLVDFKKHLKKRYRTSSLNIQKISPGIFYEKKPKEINELIKTTTKLLVQRAPNAF